MVGKFLKYQNFISDISLVAEAMQFPAPFNV